METNPLTQTPFIRLPPPHAHLILTPPLHTDSPAVVAALNHPSVYHNLSRPPFPYTPSDWEAYYAFFSADCAKTLSEYREIENGTRKWCSVGFPCPVIRDEASGQFLGEITVRPRSYLDILDLAERRSAEERNANLPDGDERKEFEVGFNLVPEAHGKGIMTAALRALMEWVTRYLGVRILRGDFHAGNLGSRSVFEKCGFVFEKVVEEAEGLDERKVGVKGKKVGLGFVVWRKDEDGEEIEHGDS